MDPTHFVKLLKPHLTIDGRTYPNGSVVEVDKRKRKALVEGGHAADHDGPAFEPEPEDEPEADAGPAGGRSRRTKLENAARQ